MSCKQEDLSISIVLLQILVPSAQSCDSLDECLVVHHVLALSSFPFHLHLRLAGDAALRRFIQFPRRDTNVQL